MQLHYDSCPNCFNKLDGKLVCKKCNTNISKIQHYDNAIEPFTIMNKKYLTGRILGKGGFGITYLAQDLETGERCCIKEYMPSAYAKRVRNSYYLEPKEEKYKKIYVNGRKSFIDEARTLVKLKTNKTVVDIWDYFEENNTAYVVMEYLDGVSLKSLAKKYGGIIPKVIADRMLQIIGQALIDVHRRGVLHRDISPENIFITQNKEIKLIDFGAARSYLINQDPGAVVVLKTGYAPPEQYSNKSSQGPWTDIYALAATYYTLVSGVKLIDSVKIMNGAEQKKLVELVPDIGIGISNAIAKAMSLDYKKRYQNVSDFLQEMGIELGVRSNVIEYDMGNVANAGGKHSMEIVTASTIPTTGNSFSKDRDPNVFEEVHHYYESHKTIIIETVVNGMPNKQIKPKSGVEIKVGRSKSQCDLQVCDDKVISRVHLFVSYEAQLQKFIVVDKSVNGTFNSSGIRLVKGQRVYFDSGDMVYLSNKKYAVRFMIQ